MMKIVSFKICPFVQRVTAMLEAKNLPYEVEYIHLDNKPEWFLKRSPHGQVPILITDSDEVLFESDAIVEYIEETSAVPLFPRNSVQKAQQRAWSYLATKNYLVQCSAQRSKNRDTLSDRSAKLAMSFAKLEAKLTGSKFFDGDRIGMVDLAWLPLLHRASIIEKRTGYDFIQGFPKVKELQQTILETGLPQKAVSADFEDKFSSFYLSAETCLGQRAKAKQGQACCATSECKDDNVICCA